MSECCQNERGDTPSCEMARVFSPSFPRWFICVSSLNDLKTSCRHQSHWSYLRHCWWRGINVHWIIIYFTSSLFCLTILLFFVDIPIKKNPKDATVSDQAGMTSQVMPSSLLISLLDDKAMWVYIFSFHMVKRKRPLQLLLPPKGKQGRK